jgi:hypothetical protein
MFATAFGNFAEYCLANARIAAAACSWAVSRVTVAADNPADEPMGFKHCSR